MSISAIYLSFSSIVFILTGYIINLIIGRYLGPIAYGNYGVIISLITAINIIQTAGIPQAVSKYIAEEEQEKELILKSGLITQITLTVCIATLFFSFSNQLANIFKDNSLKPYIQLSTCILPFYGIYALYLGYNNGLRRFGKQAIMSISYSVAKLFWVLVLMYFFKLTGIIIGFIVAPILPILLSFTLPKFVTTHHFSYKKLILFSIPLICFSLCLTLFQSLDLFFVKALTKASANAGYYNAAGNIALLPFIGLSAFSLILFPNIAKHIKDKNHKKSQLLISQAFRIIFIIITPIVFIISATSTGFVHLVYSDTYMPAAIPLSILIFGYGFMTIFSVCISILNGAGRPYTSVKIAASCLLLTGIICYVLIPQYMLIGAALATTTGTFFAMIFASIAVYRQFHVFIEIKSLYKIALGSLVVYQLAKIIPMSQYFLPIHYIFLFSFYLVLLLLMREITWKDWQQLQHNLHS